MDRIIRLLGKKKGLRRTGSRKWAVAGDVVFSVALMLIGIVLLATFITLQIQNSTEDVLYFSITALVIQFVLAIGLIVVGCYRVMRTIWMLGTSAERRGAIVSRAMDVELLNEVRRYRDDLPTIPIEKTLRHRQGRWLKYRLSSIRSSSWRLLGSAILCVSFVVIATTLVVLAIDSYRVGTTDILAICLAAAIVAASLWLVFQFFRQLLIRTGIGPTSIEISDLPIVPGNSYNIFLSQPARLRLNLLDIKFVCEEKVTYRQGTDIRTETQTVYEQRLFRKRGLTIAGDKPFQTSFELAVPADVIHSIRTPSNSVLWRIVVKGIVKGWPRVERKFPIVVIPQAKPELVG